MPASVSVSSGSNARSRVARVREVEAHRTAVNEAALSRTD